MNLNLIELLTILQLIIIQNSSDGNNIKPQAIKRLVKFRFLYATLEMSANNFVFERPLSALNIIHCGLWPKKVVHLCHKRCVLKLKWITLIYKAY